MRGKKLDLGINCFDAIVDRYGKVDDPNAGVITEELFVVGSNQKKTVVEMVGAKSVNEKQRYVTDQTENNYYGTGIVFCYVIY